MRYPHNFKIFLSNQLGKNKHKACPPAAGIQSCFCWRSADSLAKTAAATSTTTQDSNQ
uniref:Uncharacterized protein n=1 Tax=Rhizophora mucronata TaxID=61149 RepID=A0A2P2QPJ0_RHIMU